MLFHAADQKNTEASTAISAKEYYIAYWVEFTLVSTIRILGIPMKKYRYMRKTANPAIMNRTDRLIERYFVTDDSNFTLSKTNWCYFYNDFKVIFFFYRLHGNKIRNLLVKRWAEKIKRVNV